MTQQLNYAYVTLLAARFQGFARRDNDERRKKLWALITWRNAIAHDDIDAKLGKGALDPVKINLGTCKGWRSALNVLAGSLDRVAADQCQALGLPRPW